MGNRFWQPQFWTTFWISHQKLLPLRVELRTSRLLNGCSSQLSYRSCEPSCRTCCQLPSQYFIYIRVRTLLPLLTLSDTQMQILGQNSKPLFFPFFPCLLVSFECSSAGSDHLSSQSSYLQMTKHGCSKTWVCNTMLVPLLKTLQFGTTAACFQMERIVIRVYDLIPDLTVNDPFVTKKQTNSCPLWWANL